MHCESFRRWLSVWQALQRWLFSSTTSSYLEGWGRLFSSPANVFLHRHANKGGARFWFFFIPSQVFNLPCAIVFAFVYSLENSEGDKTGREEEKSFKWMHVVWVITWKLAANAVFDSRGVCIPNAHCTVTFKIWLKLCITESNQEAEGHRVWPGIARFESWPRKSSSRSVGFPSTASGTRQLMRVETVRQHRLLHTAAS